MNWNAYFEPYKANKGIEI